MYDKLIKLLSIKSGEMNITELVCPHCYSKHIVKNGKNKEKQRYLCKECRKSFIKETNSTIYCSKKDISVWNKYLECLINQYTLKKTASILKMSISTAFIWRHKILEVMKSNYSMPILKDSIQCKDIRFNESFKGNHKKTKFTMPRESYKRGYCNSYICRPSSEVCIITAIDNNNSLLISPVVNRRYIIYHLDEYINNNINEKSYFITIMFTAFCNFAKKKDIKHKIITGKTGLYNIDKVKQVHREMVNFLEPYRGVATKYLNNYMSLFNYIYINYNKEIYSQFNLGKSTNLLISQINRALNR